MRSTTFSNWLGAVTVTGAVALGGGAVGLGLAGFIGDRTPAPVVLTPQDDYGIRHLPAPQPLTLVDDYGTRHRARPAVLGPMDDYGTRHRARPAVLGPMDDYGTRHRQERSDR